MEKSKNNSKKLKKTQQQDNRQRQIFYISNLSVPKSFMKFCYYGSNFRQKFRAILGYAFRESDKNTPVPLLRSLKTKN